MNPFTAKGKFDETKKTSKSWTAQQNIKVWPLKWKLPMSILSNGGIYIVAEHSSCFCKFYV